MSGAVAKPDAHASAPLTVDDRELIEAWAMAMLEAAALTQTEVP